MAAITSRPYDLIRGLERLRLGALLGLISAILLFCTMILAISSLFTAPQAFAAWLASLIGLGLLIIVLDIVSFILWALAARSLSRYNQRYKIGWIGILLQIISIVVLVVVLTAFFGVIMTISQSASESASLGFAMPILFSMIGLLIVPAVLSIIGSILFGVMLMRLPEEPNVDSMFKTAGIIWIVAVVLMLIPYVSLVGTILMLVAEILIFIASKNSLKALRVP